MSSVRVRPGLVSERLTVWHDQVDHFPSANVRPGRTYPRTFRPTVFLVFAPRFVETSKQLADVLTKALRSAAHLQFLSLLPDLSPPTSTPDHSTDLDLSRERGCSDTPLLPSARDV